MRLIAVQLVAIAAGAGRQSDHAQNMVFPAHSAAAKSSKRGMVTRTDGCWTIISGPRLISAPQVRPVARRLARSCSSRSSGLLTGSKVARARGAS